MQMKRGLHFLRTLLLGAVVSALTGCGGGGGSGTNNQPPSGGPILPPVSQLPDPAAAPAMKDVLGGYFRVGAAIEPDQLLVESDRDLLEKHMSSITAENALKPDTIAPEDPSQAGYNFEPADRLVEFARANNMAIRGHALVWHFTAPDWFFEGPKEEDPATYRALVRQRLEQYITDVVTHFADDIYTWDVVNEVASDTDGQTYRTDSPWYEAFSVGGGDGAEYIEIAFRAARAADPDARLFINEYLTERPAKLANLLVIVDDLIAKGVPIDGVGHQLHLNLAANVDTIDAALTAVEQRTLLNHVTELDINIYQDPPTCPADINTCLADYGPTPPVAVLAAQAQLYRELYELFRTHDASIDSVTTWGLHDAHTWLTAFHQGRLNSPLMFDHDRQPKAAFWAVVDSTFTIPQ